MSFLRKVILVNSSQFVCYAIGIFQAAILSRTLGPAGIGQYTIILTSLVLVPQLFSLGLPMSMLYYSQHSPEGRKAYLMNTIWAMLLFGIVGGIVLALLLWTVSDYFGKVAWPTLLAAAVFVPVVLERQVSRSYLLINIEAKRLSVVELNASAGSFGLLLVLAVSGILDVNLAIICFFSAVFIRAGMGWMWMRPSLDFTVKPDWQTSKKLGLMGIRQSWVDLMVLFNAQVAITIIRCTIGNFESVGYFSRGVSVAMLAVTAGQAIMPLLFSRWASFPEDKLNLHVEKVMRFASTVSVFMVVVLLATAKWTVLILYGKAFLPAVQPMQILVPGTVLYLVSYALIQLLGSRGSPELAAVLLFIGAVVNGVLTWILVQMMGINGAAMAVTASNVLLLTGLILTIRKKYGINFGQCILMTREDIRSITKALSWGKVQNV